VIDFNLESDVKPLDLQDGELTNENVYNGENTNQSEVVEKIESEPDKPVEQPEKQVEQPETKSEPTEKPAEKPQSTAPLRAWAQRKQAITANSPAAAAGGAGGGNEMNLFTVIISFV